MVRRWRGGGYWPAAAAAAAAKRAAKFTPQALVNTAWSLAVIGGEALRGGAFAALWGEISARGDAAAGAPADAATSASVEFGPWRGKHLNQIHQCAVAVDAAGGADAWVSRRCLTRSRRRRARVARAASTPRCVLVPA